MVQTNGLAGHEHDFYRLYVKNDIHHTLLNFIFMLLVSLRVTGLEGIESILTWKKVSIPKYSIWIHWCKIIAESYWFVRGINQLSSMSNWFHSFHTEWNGSKWRSCRRSHDPITGTTVPRLCAWPPRYRWLARTWSQHNQAEVSLGKVDVTRW